MLSRTRFVVCCSSLLLMALGLARPAQAFPSLKLVTAPSPELNKVKIRFRNFETFPLYCSRLVVNVEYKVDGSSFNSFLEFKDEHLLAGELSPVHDRSQDAQDWVSMEIGDRDFTLGATSFDEQNSRCETDCPAGFLRIPADQEYGTRNFCVMKYEARKVGSAPRSVPDGKPWTALKQEDARSACNSLGVGYGLPNNKEWMVLASLAASVDSNWTGGVVGTGRLFQGHSDKSPNGTCESSADDRLGFVDGSCTPVADGGAKPEQKRVMKLPDGLMIWDLAGNASEWLDYNTSVKPKVPGSAWNYGELTAAQVTSDFPKNMIYPLQKDWWDDSWTSAQGIGSYFGGPDGVRGALARGGGFNTETSGLFHFELFRLTSDADAMTGFRCVYRPALMP